MPRQKQSKPKALKQQREEVEQLIRDGGPSDTKTQDGNSSAKSSKLPPVSSVVEKDRRGKGRKTHRHRNAAKVKIAKKVRKKRTSKVLPGKEYLDSNNLDAKHKLPNQASNNNEKPLIELHSPSLVVDASSEPASDSYVSDVDVYKDKYDMIKERSLKRATKIQSNNQDKERVKERESSPHKGSESPKKTPVSPVKEAEAPRSSVKVDQSPTPSSPKSKDPNSPRKLSDKESSRSFHRTFMSRTETLVKGRQRSVSEGMLTAQESKQQALEALLQITGVEFHTMSKVPPADATPSITGGVTKGTISTPIAPNTSHSGLQKASMVKISETDKGVVKYHLQSDSLEEQGLKLIYTTQTSGQANQDPVKYSGCRPRRNSTRSNASDSTDDLNAKDSPKCCKKPGRHVCQFCGRRCTKPSVLKKHIRSHTGERPYPCPPCGFSFKTKSNLYKHCKTHAHAIKAGLAPNSEDLSKLALADLDEEDSEETESEDEIVTCDATTCQTELTGKFPQADSQIPVGSTPLSEESLRKTSQDKNYKPSNIPTMQVPRSLATVPNIPHQQADIQSSQEAISRHSSTSVLTNSVLSMPTTQKDVPLLSTLVPNQSSRSSDLASGGRPSSASSTSLAEHLKSTTQQAERRSDEELVLSASGASSSQLLKSILPGELAGFRIDMETRRAIPVLSPQVGGPGSPSRSQSGEEGPVNTGQLLVPLTGFNIIKSGGQYHVQIPVQGIPEDSLTMSLEGEACSAGSSSSQTKGVSKESLQERIQLLISQNRAIVDDAVLESVKPRRTSASRRDSENNSPKMEFSGDPSRDAKSTEVRNIQFSRNPEIPIPPIRLRTSSMSEGQSSPVSYAHLKYPLESNLLERALKSQQQSSLIGTSGADKNLLIPVSVPQGFSQADNVADNSNSIKDLLMQDRPQRLAQIAQQSTGHLSGDPATPATIFIPGAPWPSPHTSDSAINQLRGTLQQQRSGPQLHCQNYPTEDVNISQRISELRGAGRRRKYKSESDVLGDATTAGPSSPKRRARKIKDMPSVVSPLATSTVRSQPANYMSPKMPAAIQKDLDLKPAVSPHTSFSSYAGVVPLQSNPLASTTHSAAYPGHLTSKFGYQAPSHHKATSTSHYLPVQSHLTSASNTSAPSHGAALQVDVRQYPNSTTSSLESKASSQPRQRAAYPDPLHLGVTPVTLHYSVGSVLASQVSSVYTQPLPSVSEVSVIQHTRMQGKSEPVTQELKLEVGQSRDVLAPSYPRPHRKALPTQSPGPGSPGSQALHLLAVASKGSDISSDIKGGSRKRSFSISEGAQTVQNQELQLPSQPPKEELVEKQKPIDDISNATPITIQLLAAVANSSSHGPRVSPRVSVESTNTCTSQMLPDIPRKSNPQGSLSKEEIHQQSFRLAPDMKQHRDMSSPELKKIKMERNSVSPKSPVGDPRSPRSESSRQSPTSLPRVPASRRHLTLDLKSPLTSRMKSPGASEASKPLLQIDPKSLLTPEALSIAESVMKLASPMKANTPITPVESARELGRLMAHAFHNAGGKVESLITSTQGTMMIGPIATPTPGSASGSRQYFIIPSPSSSQPPTGFPGPNTLFSPSASSAPSLISPLRSPLASAQPEADQAVLTKTHAPSYSRVPPQKPDSKGPLEKHILTHVKTNSALRQKVRSSKLSHSTARNRKTTNPTFCCVKRPQPMYVQQGGNRKISMYSNWRPGGNCPHPLGISWKAHLGLYDTGRNKKPKFYYVTTSISPPQGGIVTDSAIWRPEVAPKSGDSQPHPEIPQLDIKDKSLPKSTDAGSSLDSTVLDSDALKAKDKRPKETPEHSEPSRIPIFSGGYKSNENYVYVRGRGRGKYVCEECGIRCKKPSMLKKHIRTHTDMRPYQCQICVFAFKTKGNLTKHMKSKAHSKKCTKNGITATDEPCMDHQFSDADDEDTDSVDGDTSDEDEDEDEDDDISETHSESAVPVSSVVPHRERYSSVPNIQDMPESLNAQGRTLVWHQYHQGRMKKSLEELHSRPQPDSTESMSGAESTKSATNSTDTLDERQPTKLSRSEVVGKLSRHLTNRHQQSLEKAQKANVSAGCTPADTKDSESGKMFDISQLPPFQPGLLPQPTQITHPPSSTGNREDGSPPKPPVLDKYGHIVLTTSNSMSQYRLSTTVQDNLISTGKHKPSSGSLESLVSQPASVQPLPSLEKQLTRQSHPSTESLTGGSPFHQDKHRNPSHVSPVTTSSSKDHVPSLVQAVGAAGSSGFPSQHEVKSIPGSSNFIGGMNPTHTVPSRDIHMLPHYPLMTEGPAATAIQLAAFPNSFGLSPHLQKMMSPTILSSLQDPSRGVAMSSLSPKPASQSSRSQVSPRVHPSVGAQYQFPDEAAQSSSSSIRVEAISDDEDEQNARKRQKVAAQDHRIMVSGSINKPCGSLSSSVPSWMSEPGSAIKQLLLARPIVPPTHESAKPSFSSPFLPPSLASPKLIKSNLVLPMSSSLQPPLVSPMVPSKMMQLPPTILSQVRSPTSQSFPPRDDHRDSPDAFVPPVARAKSQFHWTSTQPQGSDKPSMGDPIHVPLELSEEIVTSPTHVGNHKCPTCSKVFMKPSQLRIHMRIHLEENSFSCPECMLSFPTRILLAKHERSEEHLSKVDAVELPSASGETDPRPFKCKECQIAFRIPGHLAKHLRSRGHRMTLEREGKLPVPKEELLCPEMSDAEHGDLIIDDTPQPLSPGGSSDKTDSASETGDVDHIQSLSSAL